MVHTGTTANEVLQAGIQIDSATGRYEDRARYFDASAGVFTSMDRHNGQLSDPVRGNPDWVFLTERSGKRGADATGPGKRCRLVGRRLGGRELWLAADPCSR